MIMSWKVIFHSKEYVTSVFKSLETGVRTGTMLSKVNWIKENNKQYHFMLTSTLLSGSCQSTKNAWCKPIRAGNNGFDKWNCPKWFYLLFFLLPNSPQEIQGIFFCMKKKYNSNFLWVQLKNIVLM